MKKIILVLAFIFSGRIAATAVTLDLTFFLAGYYDQTMLHYEPCSAYNNINPAVRPTGYPLTSPWPPSWYPKMWPDCDPVPPQIGYMYSESIIGDNCFSVPDPTYVTNVTVELHENSSPAYPIFGTAFTGLLKTDGTLQCTFASLPPISPGYYIVIKHRNSVETWSKLITTTITSYDFSSSPSRAYGDNQVQIDLIGARQIWAIYSGNADGNQTVDWRDFDLWKYDDLNFAFGCLLQTDFNGDQIVDLFDYIVWEYSCLHGIGVKRPQ